MKKKFLKTLIILWCTLIIWVILYHTDSGKKIFTARLHELQWEQLQDFFGTDEQTMTEIEELASLKDEEISNTQSAVKK